MTDFKELNNEELIKHVESYLLSGAELDDSFFDCISEMVARYAQLVILFNLSNYTGFKQEPDNEPLNLNEYRNRNR